MHIICKMTLSVIKNGRKIITQVCKGIHTSLSGLIDSMMIRQYCLMKSNISRDNYLSCLKIKQVVAFKPMFESKESTLAISTLKLSYELLKLLQSTHTRKT